MYRLNQYALLHCSVHDLNLPGVPPTEISTIHVCQPVSSQSSAASFFLTSAHAGDVQYLVWSVLETWETSMRQACIAEVAVTYM